MNHLTRRRFVTGIAGLGAAPLLPAVAAARSYEQMALLPRIVKTIPSTGENLPPVGLATQTRPNIQETFDVGANVVERYVVSMVLRKLVDCGGSVIDIASGVGSTEGVIGDLVAEAAVRGKVFLSARLEQPLEAQLQTSLTRLHTDQIDVIHLRDIRDPNQSLATLREWKAAGKCRYVGISTTRVEDFPAVEACLAREKPDFLEVTYSLEKREAEQRLLPLARDINAAVLTTQPFGTGKFWHLITQAPVPKWAREFDAQNPSHFLLKYMIAHPAVTTILPASPIPDHFADNLGAMHGRLPDAAQRKRMIEYVESL
jgi:diketogulonate reductase-like aldo/keto reductase